MSTLGHRLRWHDLPGEVCGAVEAALGQAVVATDDRPGGYSPSLAAACRLTGGERVFVKAASPAQNPDTPGFIRREAEISARLPPAVPAPRLLHRLEVGAWAVAVFEHVDDHLPATPWRTEDLQRVLRATWRLSDHEPPTGLTTVAERYGPVLTGWRTLAAEATVDRSLDPWSARHLDALADLEGRWEAAVAGPELVHGDVRSDNVLLGPCRVTFVDWSAACVGRTWFDLAALVPSASVEGGGPPEVLAGRAGLDDVDRAGLDALVAAIAGYFAERGRAPDPPGLPTVRAFQRAQGAVSLRWLRSRLGWS